jgi:hypothetical protein
LSERRVQHLWTSTDIRDKTAKLRQGHVQRFTKGGAQRPGKRRSVYSLQLPKVVALLCQESLYKVARQTERTASDSRRQKRTLFFAWPICLSCSKWRYHAEAALVQLTILQSSDPDRSRPHRDLAFTHIGANLAFAHSLPSHADVSFGMIALFDRLRPPHWSASSSQPFRSLDKPPIGAPRIYASKDPVTWSEHFRLGGAHLPRRTPSPSAVRYRFVLYLEEAVIASCSFATTSCSCPSLKLASSHKCDLINPNLALSQPNLQPTWHATAYVSSLKLRVKDSGFAERRTYCCLLTRHAPRSD